MLYTLLKPTYTHTVISWGLIPNTHEQIPAATIGGSQLLHEYKGLYVGVPQDRSVYFTFDLGSESGYTDDILNILKDNNIKAIFFLCSGYLTEKHLIDRMITEGHLIGNHTDKHKDLPTLSSKGIKKEIVAFQQKFKKQYPHCDIKYFRPPEGRFDERVLKRASAEGLRTMLWSIAIRDWEETPMDVEHNLEIIIQRLHPGAIILLHIRNSGASELLMELLPRIAEKGYRAGHPDELSSGIF